MSFITLTNWFIYKISLYSNILVVLFRLNCLVLKKKIFNNDYVLLIVCISKQYNIITYLGLRVIYLFKLVF